MVAFLQQPVTTIAFCWRLARRDGVSLGFTTHDRDLAVDNLLYRSAPGMLPSAIQLSDGLDADSMDIRGALTSDAITEGDLMAGRWEGASVTVLVVDWSQPDGENITIATGELGAVSVEGDAFTAELMGPTAILDQPVCELTSPECRAQLGDHRCRVPLAPLTHFARIAEVIDDRTLRLDAVTSWPNAYAYGRLRWVTGENSGLFSAVLRSEGELLTLRNPPPFSVEPGELVVSIEGCDRSFATCRDRFANAENFRGEPHLPGNDLLTRYPGAS